MVYMEQLRSDLGRIATAVRDEDRDYFIVIIGKERTGKSSLAEKIAGILKEHGLSFDVSDIVFERGDFARRVLARKKGDSGVIWADEGMMIFHALEGNQKDAKKVYKLVSAMGSKNLVVIICIPDVLSLHKYIREHRMDMLIKVYKRGVYAVYGQKGSRAVVEFRKNPNSFKKRRKPMYLYREQFGKAKGTVWDAYLKKKEAQVEEYDDFEKELEEEVNDKAEKVEVESVNLMSARKITGLTGGQIRYYFDKGKIEGYKLPSGHRRYFKHSLLKFIGVSPE